MAVCVANDERVEAPYDPDAIQAIDWRKFRGQKKTLCSILEKYREEGRNNKQIGQLAGILNLLDSMQDYAVQELGVSFEEVWGL